jgi:SOS response regulatory protein OraA/RecX
VIGEVQDEAISIEAILDKKLKTRGPLTPESKQKITAYLARLGYPWTTIAKVVKSWESE